MYNRNEELINMFDEINDLPDKLDMANIKKTVKRKVFVHRVVTAARNTAAIFALLITTFIVGVNVSPTFADSVSKIGFLRQLVEAVNFNEGFKDAVENDYVTEVHQIKETKFGDMELAYFIADEKNMVIFLKTDSIKESVDKENIWVEIDSIKNSDTGEVEEVGGEIPRFDEEYVALHLGLWPDGFAYPDNLEVTLKFTYEEEYDFATFNLKLGEPLEARVYEINEEIEHRGQKITVDRVTVYPTCTYVEYREDSNNDMDIISLDFHLIDENGVKRGNERKSTYFDDNGMYIASGYFRLEGNISLVLDKLFLLPKEKRNVKYNMSTKRFTDCDGALDYIRVVEENEPVYQEYLMDEEVIAYLIDSEEVQALGYASVFSEIDHETGEFTEAWFGVMGIDGVDYHTMPKTVKADKNGDVALYREFPEYFDEPNLVIPIDK